MNIAEAFKKTALLYPDKPMVVFQHQTYTFQQMDQLSDQLAAGLSSINVQTGDILSIGLPNRPEIIVSILAAAKLGVTIIPLNTMLKEKELSYVFRNSPVKAAITFQAHADILAHLKNQGIEIPKPVVVGKCDNHDVISFESLLKKKAEPKLPVQLNEKDLFLIVYTSGTTGEPKGVMLTHENALSVVQSVASFQQRSELDTGVCFFPLTHITGIVNFIVDSIAIGATIVLQERFDVDDYLDNFGQYQCSVLGAVSPVFQAILASPRLDEIDFSNLRLITSGGASLPIDLYQRLQDRFDVPILEMYGMTENAATLTSNPIEKQKKGSVGIALPGMDVRVVDEDDLDVGPDKVGEVIAKGPGLMRGYYNRKDLTKKALRGGWYHTGDLGRLDRDGFLYIVDRKDDMINAGAFKIYPREVEEVLYTHPDVQDCAVVGVPDDRLGQIPVAYVVTEKGDASILPELKTFCTRKIANYKVPRHFHHVKELPRTPQGKVMKRMLTEI